MARGSRPVRSHKALQFPLECYALLVQPWCKNQNPVQSRLNQKKLFKAMLGVNQKGNDFA
jgi:hypothetical protein